MSTNTLGQRYRQASDPIERSHWQILWLLTQGRTAAEVAQVTGFSVDRVRMLAWRYNQQGADGLRDARHRNQGRPPLLTPEQAVALEQALEVPPPAGGQWAGPKVALWNLRTHWASCRPPTGLGLFATPGVRVQGAASAACPGRSSGPRGV
jgi:hypothetical protein